jgi:hypothetical protein
MSIPAQAKEDFSKDSKLRSTKDSGYESPVKSQYLYSVRKLPLKVLPTYIFNLATPKKIFLKSQSKKSTPKQSNSGTNSSRNKSTEKKITKKVIKRSNSSVTKLKLGTGITKVANFDYELEKLLRIIFRHCVICPGLKSELSSMGADTLLRRYAEHRLKNN